MFDPSLRNYRVLRDFDSLWDFSRPKETEAAFRAVLAEAGPDAPAPYRLILRTQIARALGLQRRFDEAHAELDAVDRESTETDGDTDPILVVRSLLERGRVFNSSGHPQQAAPLFQQAWDAASASGLDALAVDAAHMLAIVSADEPALAWNRTALALAESSHDPKARKWRASLLNNIGWSHHGAGRFTEALSHFERALDARLAAGDPASIRIARWCVARCLRSLGRTEEALAAQQSLAADHAAAGTTDGFVHEELGECLLALNRPPHEYAPHFHRAHEVLSSNAWLAEREPERITRLARLARLAKPGG